jgi:hypothetical protein
MLETTARLSERPYTRPGRQSKRTLGSCRKRDDGRLELTGAWDQLISTIVGAGNGLRNSSLHSLLDFRLTEGQNELWHNEEGGGKDGGGRPSLRHLEKR